MEIALQIGLCRGEAIDFGVVIDKGEVLALLTGIAGGIFFVSGIDMVCIL